MSLHRESFLFVRFGSTSFFHLSCGSSVRGVTIKTPSSLTGLMWTEMIRHPHPCGVGRNHIQKGEDSFQVASASWGLRAAHWIKPLGKRCFLWVLELLTGLFSFFSFRATPAAHGSFQTRGQIGTAGAIVTSTPDLSLICDLDHNSWQRHILNPQSKARD